MARVRQLCSAPGRGLTIHSSRTRFAGRLNSGVRPHMEHARSIAVLSACHSAAAAAASNAAGVRLRSASADCASDLKPWPSMRSAVSVCIACSSGSDAWLVLLRSLVTDCSCVMSAIVDASDVARRQARRSLLASVRQAVCWRASSLRSSVALSLARRLRPNNSFKPNPLRGSA